MKWRHKKSNCWSKSDKMDIGAIEDKKKDGEADVGSIEEDWVLCPILDEDATEAK